MIKLENKNTIWLKPMFKTMYGSVMNEEVKYMIIRKIKSNVMELVRVDIKCIITVKCYD